MIVSGERILGLIMLNGIIINIGLGIFNLIPIPPLDGSKILMHFLPYQAKFWLQAREQIFLIVFLFAWMLGILGRIVSPIIFAMYDGMVWIVLSVAGIFI